MLRNLIAIRPTAGSSQQTAFAVCVLLLTISSAANGRRSVLAAEPELKGESAPKVDYAGQVQTILARRCYACHGPDLQEGSLRFDDRETLLGEADSGLQAIVTGKSSESELIRRITSDEEWERMPPEGKPLSEAEVELLSRWIDQGAEYTEHWAFQPIQNPPVPLVADPSWSTNSIDNFVLARLDAAKLTPVKAAETRTLIRRLYLDITGLPPTPEVVNELLRDWRDDSYEALVDELLAAPEFGERWARHWLDVVRYAETNSFERDGRKENAWKYRDYVIAAMNSDKPYSQFIREQIAGDELDVVTDESLTATGYYRLGLWDDEPADPKQAVFDGFDDLVTTTSQGILGLTLNCARCHDHKIDPLTQKDYYRMVAFMRDVTPFATRGDRTSFNQVDLNPGVAAQHREIEKTLRENQKQARKIEQAAIKKMSAPDQRATEGPQREEVLREKMVDFCDADTFAMYQQLRQESMELVQALAQLPPRETVLGLAKVDREPETTFVLLRGSPHAEGEAVELEFPKLLGGGRPELPGVSEGESDEATTAGRRRILADWLASDDNWMTARVIVNRLWLHYFGRGIVRSPNNFGLMGDPPTHPLLIDHLAQELIRDDWSLKSIHRKILLSSTYRMATSMDAKAAAQDPGNNLFWRQNLRRLSAEQVRDSVLAATGQLNSQVFGESMYPKLSAEVLASQSQPGAGWEDSSAADRARRSIYIHVKRSLPVPMMSVFDFPETDVSCEARFLTTQPGQALNMLNSAWMQEQADRLLDRVKLEVGDDLRLQATRCLEITQCRTPSPVDIEELQDLVARLQSKHELSDRDARHAMCLAVLNLNEFLYID